MRRCQNLRTSSHRHTLRNRDIPLASLSDKDIGETKKLQHVLRNVRSDPLESRLRRLCQCFQAPSESSQVHRSDVSLGSRLRASLRPSGATSKLSAHPAAAPERSGEGPRTFMTERRLRAVHRSASISLAVRGWGVGRHPSQTAWLPRCTLGRPSQGHGRELASLSCRRASRTDSGARRPQTGCCDVSICSWILRRSSNALATRLNELREPPVPVTVMVP